MSDQDQKALSSHQHPVFPTLGAAANITSRYLALDAVHCSNMQDDFFLSNFGFSPVLCCAVLDWVTIEQIFDFL